METAVWAEVTELLKNPTRIEEEYQRRNQKAGSVLQQHIAPLEAQKSRLKAGIGRLIDSYAEGLIDKTEFEPRVAGMKKRLAELDAQVEKLNNEAELHRELKLIIGRLEEFAERVADGLERVDQNARREIVRLLVKRVEIDKDEVTVIFRVGDVPDVPKPEKFLHYCGRGTYESS